MADLNGSINGPGEPNLAQMAKYTIALQESFEKIFNPVEPDYSVVSIVIVSVLLFYKLKSS